MSHHYTSPPISGNKIISVCDPVFYPAATYFRRVSISAVNHLSQSLITYLRSPIDWRKNHRKTENFQFSDFLGLDLDDGMTVIETQHYCRSHGYRYVIGATRHHGLQKKDSPPRDRFRLIIPWSDRLTCFPDYQYTVSKIIADIGADTNGNDCARMFLPCTRILASSVEGEGVKCLAAPPKPKRKVYVRPQLDGPRLPSWLQSMLINPVSQGERNITCFRAALWLTRYGFSSQEVVDAVMAMPIDLSEKEKMVAIESGIKSGAAK
jgi:hypothetical protein